jgi:diguanylate cyclase (GGDEF)-like protein
MEQLRDLAYRDPLTGLLNRRGMYDRLVELAASGVSGSLAFVDLDNLRELNDGDELWEDGDKAIAGVAERLNESFGAANVGRWGGDEYLVVAPRVSAGQAGEMLERILEVCRRELIVSGRPITFSAGVVACESESFDAARDLAERAVKDAKDRRATVKVVSRS